MPGGGLDADDRRALAAGAIALAIITVLYPFVAEATGRPLAVYVLPSLLTVVLGGWRPTLVVGTSSMLLAIVIGVMGPLSAESLAARWFIIGAAVVAGAVGAAVREHQAGRLADLHETTTLLKAFERALVPSPLQSAGFVAAVRYRAAESRMHTGGDFLDAIPLTDRRLAVVIGDVCGHGPREAAFGAVLRAGWKSIVLGDRRDPAEWIDALNTSFFADGRIDTYVTMCTGYVDLDARVSRLVNAGHPPPVSLERRARVLDLPPSPPLGLGLGDTWKATELRWGGEPLLLYTDGLIENPTADGPARRWHEEGLLAWLNRSLPVTDAASFLDELMHDATTGRDLRDDIAFLMVAAAR